MITLRCVSGSTKPVYDTPFSAKRRLADCVGVVRAAVFHVLLQSFSGLYATDPASASQSTFRCGRAIGRRLLHFAASSLPLPGIRAAIEGACSAWRSQIGIYRQASTQPGPSVRHNETIVHQRGGQPGVARAAAARARAWVSRRQVGHGPVGWSIDLIVCCGTSWRKPICCWCRTNGGQSAESGSDFWNHQNPSRR
jgi:hypothetical protein